MRESNITHSPTYKGLNDPKKYKHKLMDILHGTDIKDLALDFLGTQYFSDIYLFDTMLGTGGFGVVVKVIDRDTGEELAMKVRDS